MPARKRTSKSKQVDPDDAPHLDEEWFDRAEIWRGNKLIRPGRPKSDDPKQALNIRLDADVLERFRATGPGWQTRINDALRKAAGLKPRKKRGSREI